MAQALVRARRVLMCHVCDYMAWVLVHGKSLMRVTWALVHGKSPTWPGRLCMDELHSNSITLDFCFSLCSLLDGSVPGDEELLPADPINDLG